MEDAEIICRNDVIIRRELKKLTREELVEVVDAWEDVERQKRGIPISLSTNEMVKEKEIRNYRIYPKDELIDYIIRYKMVSKTWSLFLRKPI
jgi:hypothetical protein